MDEPTEREHVLRRVNAQPMRWAGECACGMVFAARSSEALAGAFEVHAGGLGPAWVRILGLAA